jgi:hypothetical protein
MLVSFGRRLAVVSFFLALAACANAPADDQPVVPTLPEGEFVTPQDDNPFGSILNECLYYTNISRNNFGLNGFSPANGLQPWSSGPWEALQQAAFNHARDMATRNYFSHYTPEGWSPDIRVQGLGYNGSVGENIYCGSGNPGDAVGAWMNSDGHRANILNPGFTKVGIAHYYDPNSWCKHYWVMVLGR